MHEREDRSVFCEQELKTGDFKIVYNMHHFVIYVPQFKAYLAYFTPESETNSNASADSFPKVQYLNITKNSKMTAAFKSS